MYSALIVNGTLNCHMASFAKPLTNDVKSLPVRSLFLTIDTEVGVAAVLVFEWVIRMTD